jgi:hypothetical protein
MVQGSCWEVQRQLQHQWFNCVSHSICPLRQTASGALQLASVASQLRQLRWSSELRQLVSVVSQCIER